MLPDFPSLKAKFREKLYELSMERTERYLGIWGKVGKHELHEGKGQHLSRHDGTLDEMEPVPLMVQIPFGPHEVESLTMQEMLRKLDTAAREMALKQSALFDSRFEEAVTGVGNTVNAAGKTNVQALTELIEKIDLDFRPDGKPDFPQIKQEWGQEWFVQVINEIAADLALKKDFIDLMARKKEEFLDRENNRKLVG
jgi:hypothetical protein